MKNTSSRHVCFLGYRAPCIGASLFIYGVLKKPSLIHTASFFFSLLLRNKYSGALALLFLLMLYFSQGLTIFSQGYFRKL